jgi:protein gp37
MGKQTEIAWTDHSFNPWWGCVRVSPGCVHCYAESFAKRTGNKVWGVEAPRRFFGEKHWREPISWNAAAEKAGVRKRVFCASMADVFEGRADLMVWRDRLWAMIESTPWLDWQLLTKRPHNIVGMLPERWRAAAPANLWLGTTAEDQEHYAERWPLLAEAAHEFGVGVTFVSYEPALGPLELMCHGCGHNVAAHHAPDQGGCSGWFPHWVIVGGESGNGARPFALEWATSVVGQCKRSPIRCFVKQLGRSPLVALTGQKLRLVSDKGGDMSEWPVALRVRQFPSTP